MRRWDDSPARWLSRWRIWTKWRRFIGRPSRSIDRKFSIASIRREPKHSFKGRAFVAVTNAIRASRPLTAFTNRVRCPGFQSSTSRRKGLGGAQSRIGRDQDQGSVPTTEEVVFASAEDGPEFLLVGTCGSFGQLHGEVSHRVLSECPNADCPPQEGLQGYADLVDCARAATTFLEPIEETTHAARKEIGSILALSVTAVRQPWTRTRGTAANRDLPADTVDPGSIRSARGGPSLTHGRGGSIGPPGIPSLRVPSRRPAGGPSDVPLTRT